MLFEVSENPLNRLTPLLVERLRLFGLHAGLESVDLFLIRIATYGSTCLRRRRAACLQRALGAVRRGSLVDVKSNRVSIGSLASLLVGMRELFAFWTDVDLALVIPLKVVFLNAWFR